MLVVQNSRVKIVGARNRSLKTTINIDLEDTHLRFATHSAVTTSGATPGETWMNAGVIRVSVEHGTSEDVRITCLRDRLL